ncbi:MAG TPA: hypothetical protein VN577_10575 [Terriglobales bacterium]|nr:hypothetical protein [Terriglobales bacterium]
MLLLFVSLVSFAAEPDKERAEKAERDNPRERESWFLRGRTFKGRPAPQLLKQAHQQRDTLRYQAIRRAQVRTAAVASPLPSPIWSPLGPAPLKSVPNVGDQQDYGFTTGRATAVVVDQNDPTGNTVYLTGAYGGVWKSTSAANTDLARVFWTPIIDDQETIAVGSMAIQPGNSNLLLVGTGEANSSSDSYYGLGILRSTDGGVSWSLISTANNGARLFHGLAFAKIAFSTDNPNIVVAATAAASVGTANGLDQSPSAAECADLSLTRVCRGIYYSYDSGQSWTQATMVDPGGAPDAGSVSSVHYNPQQHKFYAASRFHGFYVSSDGVTWYRMSSDPSGFNQPSSGLNLTACPTVLPTNTSSRVCPLYRGEITQVPGRDEMYVWYVNADNPPVNGGIYQTKDGGKTWVSLNVSGITNCGDTQGCGTEQGDFNLALMAVPNGATATDLYAGAINIFRCQINSNNSTCSSNAFVNLTHVYGCDPFGSLSKVHPDQHGFDMVQANANILYFANDGGITRTLSSYSTQAKYCDSKNPNAPTILFDNLNGTMGSMTQFVWFSQHPTDQYTMLGGTQDNGSPMIDSDNSGPNGLAWRSVLLGDGGYNDINPQSPNDRFASFPISPSRVLVARCTTGENCSDSIFSSNQVVTSAKLGNDTASFYMPYMLDPQDSSKLVVGTCRVWRVGTNGSSAVALSQNFSNGTTNSCASGSAYISALAAGGPVNSSGSQVLYAGTDNGKVFFTPDATDFRVTWTEISNNGAFSNSAVCGSTSSPARCPISGIAIDPRDATGRTAYVTIMGFNTPHVWQTTDGGNSWSNITGNLPDAPANGAVVYSGDGSIYVATDVGVYSTASPSGGNTIWTEVGPATGAGTLPNVAVTRIAIFAPTGSPARLRASTYGRGVWEIPIAGSSAPDFAVTIPDSALVTFPGQVVTFNGSITTANGYSSAINLSCDATTNGTPGPLPQTCSPSMPVNGIFTVTAANPTVQDFGFRIVAAGTDPSMLTRQVPVSLRVIDFTLGTPQPSSITNLIRGNSTTLQVTVASVGSFNQQITFGCSGLPAGWRCSAFPVTLTPGGSTQVALTIYTTAATAENTYNFSLTATSPGLITPKQQPVSVQVVAGQDFSIGAPTFSSPTRKIGEQLSTTFTVTPQDGYNGTVIFSCAGTSAGIAPSACAFNPPSTVVDTTPVPVALTVLTNAGTASSGQITIQANDGTRTKNASVPFSLTDYSFSNLTLPNNTNPGGTVKFSFHLTPLNGYSSPVTLSCDTSQFTVPVSCQFNPASGIVLTPGTTTTVNASIAIPSSLPEATYSVLVRTSDQSFPALFHDLTTAQFQISATPNFAMDFGTKTSATVAAGQSTTSALSVTAQGSFNSPVAFTVAGCPSQATCTLSPNPITPTGATPATATLTITTTAASSASVRSTGRNLFALWLGLPFGAIGFVLLDRKRRSLALLVITFATMCALSACGGGGGGTTNPPTFRPGTPAGTYTITVTGTGSTIVKQANFTLTVQ